MRKYAFAAVTAWLAASPAAAFADSGLLAKVGLMGAGIEYVQPLSKFSAVRAVFNSGSLDETATESGIDYNLTLDLRSAGVIFDWHPFAGVFYTSLGLLYNKNEFEAVSTSSGIVTVGNNVYVNPDLKGEITFNTSAPYLGIGWGHSPGGKGLSAAFEIGVLFQGSPKVNFSSNSGVGQSDLDREAADLESELEKYKYYPQVALSLGFRF